MPSLIGESIDPKQRTGPLRWFVFALVGLLIAGMCGALYTSKDALAKTGSSSERAPASSGQAKDAPGSSGQAKDTPGSGGQPKDALGSGGQAKDTPGSSGQPKDASTPLVKTLPIGSTPSDPTPVGGQPIKTPPIGSSTPADPTSAGGPPIKTPPIGSSTLSDPTPVGGQPIKTPPIGSSTPSDPTPVGGQPIKTPPIGSTPSDPLPISGQPPISVPINAPASSPSISEPTTALKVLAAELLLLKDKVLDHPIAIAIIGLPKQVEDLVSGLMRMVDGLLGGLLAKSETSRSLLPNVTSIGEPATALKVLAAELLLLKDRVLDLPTAMAIDLPRQIGDLATKLMQLVSGLLSGLLGGGEAPRPTDAPFAPASLETFAARIVPLADGTILSEQFYRSPTSDSFSVPSNSGGRPSDLYSPAQPPPPIPSSPSPISSYLMGGSGTLGSGGYPVLLMLGVLASSSILLLKSRLSWLYCELPKPSSALQLAIERPG